LSELVEEKQQLGRREAGWMVARELANEFDEVDVIGGVLHHRPEAGRACAGVTEKLKQILIEVRTENGRCLPRIGVVRPHQAGDLSEGIPPRPARPGTVDRLLQFLVADAEGWQIYRGRLLCAKRVRKP
jgi:hypothetical protein